MHKKIRAAVAVVEWVQKEDSFFLLLQRTQRPGDPWSGQLAFPGGHVEPSDPSLLHTCIRETKEECALHLTPSHLAGELPLSYAGQHRNQPVAVQAFHFLIEEAPQLTLQPEEMDAFYWLSRRKFSDPQLHVLREPLSGLGMFPGFPVQNQFLWGFTYGVLCRLIDLASTSADDESAPDIPAEKTGKMPS